jgi:hypothetical protein
MSLTIQELEEQYKIDDALIIPLTDTTDYCNIDCRYEKTKQIIEKYKDVVALKANLKNQQIMNILKNGTVEHMEDIIEFMNRIEFYPEKDLDIIIDMVQYIKGHRI